MAAAEETHRRREGCVHRAFRGDVLVVDHLDRQLRLTGTSSLVWIALDEPGTLSDVRARLRHADVAPSVTEDPRLAEGLALLVAQGLVVPDGARGDRAARDGAAAAGGPA